MRRWLKGDSRRLENAEEVITQMESAEDLACLEQLPADSVNYHVQHTFTRTAGLHRAPTQEAWAERKAELKRELDSKVFRWFPPGKVPFATVSLRNSGGYMPQYARYQDFSFQSEDGVRIRAQLLTPPGEGVTAPLLIYVKRAGDSIYAMDMDELLPLLGRYVVLILNPRFTEVPPGPAEYADIERTAVWVGRTVAAMQVWDIRRAVDWALQDRRFKPSAISVYGKGDMGILALYAAIMDDRVGTVVLNDPPASHWQGPALLNVLQVTDIAEVAGVLAPRRLVAVTKLPEEYDHAKGLYELQGAAAQFVTSGSLPDALEVWRYSSTAGP
jgi:hypothetical protein